MIFELSFRSSRVGGPVTSGWLSTASAGAVIQSQDAETLLAQHSRVVFLVHGYNVDRDSGREHLGALADRLTDWVDAIVVVLWPGDHFTKAFSYPWEGEDADDTARQLDDFITRVLRPDTTVSFITHSLGARVALETVHRLPSSIHIDQLVMMAPAVDDDCLTRDKRYFGQVSSRVSRITTLSSMHDRVLKFAYPIGDLLQAFLHFWKDEPGKPMGLYGPQPQSKQPAGVVGENTNDAPEPVESRRVDHSDYLPSSNPNAKQLAAADYSRATLMGDFVEYVLP